MANKDVNGEENQERRNKSKKLALVFATVALLWYVVAMIVIWTQ